MKHYEYNYNFLAEWLRDHPKMKYKAAKAIGTSAASLNRWVVDIDNPHHKANHLDKNGKEVNPINIERLLAFCNQFDVDLSCFFVESGAAANIYPKMIDKAASPCRDEAVISQEHENNILRLRLEHIQEVQRIQLAAHDREESLRLEYRQREEQLRKDYEARIDEYQDMVRDGMNTTRLALLQKEDQQNNYGSTNFGVSDYTKKPRR